MFEHAKDGVEEFAHDGDQGDHFGFAASAQMLIEGAQVGLVAKGDERVATARFLCRGPFAGQHLRTHGIKDMPWLPLLPAGDFLRFEQPRVAHTWRFLRCVRLNEMDANG